MPLIKQSALEYWLKKGWKVAGDGEHPLDLVTGQQLGEVTTLVLLGPKNRFGAQYFQVFLLRERSQIAEPPVVFGLYSSGPYPSYNWVEVIRLAEHVTFVSPTEGGDHILDVRSSDLDRELLKRIADLIPPGGHMMIEYDSPEQRETARALDLGIPLAATPLGYLLYSIGCGVGFRDWYFAEGGSEGPRKLQGYKPLNEEHARERVRDLVGELLKFLERPVELGHADVEELARKRAEEILSSIDINHSDLQQAIHSTLASHRQWTILKGGSGWQRGA